MTNFVKKCLSHSKTTHVLQSSALIRSDTETLLLQYATLGYKALPTGTIVLGYNFEKIPELSALLRTEIGTEITAQSYAAASVRETTTQGNFVRLGLCHSMKKLCTEY